MNPLAILVSDLHIQTRTPKARGEPVWLDVLTQMADDLKALKSRYNCPILMAGDLFDHWAPPIEAIAWALDHLPQMFAIPGQHDLPAHNYEGRHRGAYGILARVGRIIDLPPDAYDCIIPGWAVVSVPWGHPVPPAPAGKSILMAHQYAAHNAATAYTGSNATPVQNTVRGYTVALYGDNHIPWSAHYNGTHHFNHGCWVRRTMPERTYPPGGPGLLWPDGTVTRSPANLTGDVWAAPTTPEQPGLAVAARYLAFVGACRAARLQTVNFLERLTTAATRVGGPVAGVLTEVREHCDGQRDRI